MVDDAEAAKWVVKTEENDNRIVIASTDKERTAVDLNFTYTVEDEEDPTVYYVNLIITNETPIFIENDTNIDLQEKESKLLQFAENVSTSSSSLGNLSVHVFFNTEIGEGQYWRLTMGKTKDTEVTLYGQQTQESAVVVKYTLTINPTE